MKLNLEMAEKSIEAVKAKAQEIGVPMAIAVVDEGGRVVAKVRMDGAGYLSADIAEGKACAAVAFKRPTNLLSQIAQSLPHFFAGVATLAHGFFLASGGGVPIKIGGEIIGGIGVAGGTAEQDAECAKAGLDLFPEAEKI